MLSAYEFDVWTMVDKKNRGMFYSSNMKNFAHVFSNVVFSEKARFAVGRLKTFIGGGFLEYLGELRPNHVSNA